MKRFKLLFLVLMFVGLANATVYYVSSTGDNTDGLSWATAYTSPTAALAGSPVAGDEVWVKQGTYVSASTLSWKTGINFYGGFIGTETLRSQRSTDASLTVLEGNRTNRVLNAPSMASGTTWSGFTVQKGKAATGAGAFLQKNAILDNCIFQYNTATNSGGGLYIQGTSGDADSIKVINCVVRADTAAYAGAGKYGGGGIYMKAGSWKGIVRGCTIDGNVVDGLANSGSDIDGGGVYVGDGTLDNCIVKNNIATNRNASTKVLSITGKCQGGGLMIMPQTTANPIVIKNCSITGNISQTSLGGGIAIDPLWTSALIAAPVNISKTIINNNFAYKSGGGIMADGQFATSTSSYKLENCVISNNRTQTGQGGAAFVNNIAGYSGTVTFTNCHIVNNRMCVYNYGGAGLYFNNIATVIKNCVFWGNLNAGTSPLKHHIRTAGVDGNQILNCAFDTRFVTSDVYTTTTLTGTVSIELSNTGSDVGKLYPAFVTPTNFTGNVVTATLDSLSMISNANWAITSASACLNAGTTSTATTDIVGLVRPQGGSYDIGAYELAYYNTTISFNDGGTVNSYTTGTTDAQPKGKQLNFTITPNHGIGIQSILYNGTEVKTQLTNLLGSSVYYGGTYSAPALSANSTLLVVFEIDPTTGLNPVTNDFQCLSTGKKLEVRGLTIGAEVTVYTVAGLKMATKTVSASIVSFGLPQGIYLVKVANTIKKVIIP